jgi:lipoprotein-anchoring transpeptidase ErfK/SrfK
MGTPVLRRFIAFCAVAAALIPAAGTASAADFTETLLSNERDTSRWAYVAEKTKARQEPNSTSPKVKTLTTTTPDGTTELVLTLRERVLADGSIWTQVRLPMKGASPTGWVKRSALGKYHVIHSRLEIDRAAFTITLFENEVQTYKASIAVGKRGYITPTGNFYVRERLSTTDPDGFYGPYAVGLSAYVDEKHSDWPGGSIVGIHGTDAPGAIPGRATRSCIRLRNKAMRSLFKKLPAGTPVQIL